MRLAAFLSLALCLSAPAVRAEPVVRDGDLIFQTSHSGQSEAIQRATHSPFSHVGMVFQRNGRPFVFEAIATVRYTPLDAWIARGDGARYSIKRLKRPLTPVEVTKLRKVADHFAGRSYDLYFEWSDDRIYCSELVWKIYEEALGLRLGKLQKLRDFDLDDAVVRAKLRERYGERVPLDEPVISPAAVFASPLLVPVANR
jgi:hypothetical protein